MQKGEVKMNKGLTELYIRKLKTKLEKTISECLLKGKCVQEIHELSPRQEFNYMVLDCEKPSPVKGPIFNSQIYVICEQIGRLEKQLSEAENGLF